MTDDAQTPPADAGSPPYADPALDGAGTPPSRETTHTTPSDDAPEGRVEAPHAVPPPTGDAAPAPDGAGGGGAAEDDDATSDDAAGEDELDPELRAAQDPRSPGQLLVALEEAEATRDEYLDALQRGRAEFDNYRRRTTREAETARRAGAGDLARSLLEVLDDLDRTAEVAASSADDGLAAGISAVHRKLVDALVAAGIRRIDEVDVPFDATRHEAVQQVPAEEPVDEPEVAQVLRPGYVHGDRCLRPAMVVVRQ